MNGKGDRYRPVDKKVWDRNYARIYGVRKRPSWCSSRSDGKRLRFTDKVKMNMLEA